MAYWIRQLLHMQEIRGSNPPVVTGICDPNESRARDHPSFKSTLSFRSKLPCLGTFRP